MRQLIEGLQKFSNEIYPSQREHFEALAKGQSPHTMLITCSDSRIDPSLVTQSNPGDIFIVRNAGNIVPPHGASRGGEAATIEFGVDGLKVKNVIVCGHTQCGAMAALCGNVDMSRLPATARWLEHASATRKRLEEKPGSTLMDCIEDNVLVQIQNLKTHPCISAGLEAGRIRVYGWVYHFEKGYVSVYEKRRGHFTPVTALENGSKIEDELSL